MFKKLLNVGKGHSHDRLQQQQQRQQQQLQQKNLFQLNEIKSYGFSHLNCLGYSQSLSLLAVGSKHGLLRVLGNPSVEFNHQLESGNSIRQIEFIDCRPSATSSNNSGNSNKRQNNNNSSSSNATNPSNEQSSQLSAKLIVLTDNCQLHLFELKTVKQQNFADNTTQTDSSAAPDCCQQQQQNGHHSMDSQQSISTGGNSLPEYTELEHAGVLNYFKFQPDDEDRSKRVTTLETSADGQLVYVGTEDGNLYLVPLDKFEPLSSQQVQQINDNKLLSHQRETGIKPITEEATTAAATANDKTTATNSNAIEASKSVADGKEDKTNGSSDEETTAVNLNDEPTQVEEVVEPFELIEFEKDVASQLGDDIKVKKQGAIESIKRHPSSNGRILVSYHRGLNVLYDLAGKSVEKYFYHNQALESSCFAGSQASDFFYTSHNDGSYIKWDTRRGNQTKANDDFIGQVYGPFPSKPTPKIQACTGLLNDQLEELIIFSGGMPRATYEDKNPVTIVRVEADGKDSIKTVLDFTSKVLDFVVITRPRGNLGSGAKSTSAGGAGSGGGGKKNKNKQQQQQQQQRNQPIAVALAILAEEEFVVIDLLNSDSYLEFPLPYLNCVHSSAITCNQHYSDISDELYGQLLAYQKQQLKGKCSTNDWPITGGKVIEAPEVKSHDILLTGHEDGSVDIWDVSDLSMRHLLHLSTSKYFSANEDDLVPIDGIVVGDNSGGDGMNNESTSNNQGGEENNGSAWPPLKRVGRFDPFSDDTRLAIRRVCLCPQTGTLVVAGTGGQVLVFELKGESSEVSLLEADEVTIVSDNRFTWKGREKLAVRQVSHKQEPGYQVAAFVQLNPPVAATSIDLRSDWRLFAVGTSYGFLLYDYAGHHPVVHRCTLNVQDFAIVSGDGAGVGTISRKKSFRKSLRESFRRLRIGRSQRGGAPQGQQQPPMPSGGPAKPTAFGGRGVTTGVRTLGSPASASGATPSPQAAAMMAAAAHRNLYSAERQVEQKVELSSIVKCISLTSAVIANNASFKPSLWVGTNSGQVLVYAIDLASDAVTTTAAASTSVPAAGSDEPPHSPTEAVPSAAQIVSDPAKTVARLAKEIQLKHKAPIIAIFATPEAPMQQQQAPASEISPDSAKSTPEKRASELLAAATTAADDKPTAEGEQAQSPPRQPLAAGSVKSTPSKKGAFDAGLGAVQPRVLICSEEQFKVFNLPNLKPFCKFKLTANEGLRAKKISITQFLKPNLTPANIKQSVSSGALSSARSVQSFATQTSPPSTPVPPLVDGGDEAATTGANGKQTESNNNSLNTLNNNQQKATTEANKLLDAKFGVNTKTMDRSLAATVDEQQLVDGGHLEPYMVCMSNQGDCAIYSVPDLKRQAQIQVCKREDVIGITSTMLTNHGEGYYLKSSSDFQRFSISTQRVLRVLSVV